MLWKKKPQKPSLTPEQKRLQKLDDELTLSACGGGTWEDAEEIINRGADPNYLDGPYASFVTIVAHSAVDVAVGYARNAAKYNINLNLQDGSSKNTALMIAVKKGWDHTDILDQDFYARCDEVHLFQRRFWKEKAWRKDFDWSKYANSLPIKGDRRRLSEFIIAALENGADPNIPDREGNTPLHVAMLKREIPTIAILLKYGARLDIKNNEGLFPEDMLKKDYKSINAYLYRETEHTSDIRCNIVYIHTLQDQESWEKARAPIQEMIRNHKATHPSSLPAESETTRWREGTNREPPGIAPAL
jgi:ankyrin repeat protein